MSWIHLDDWVAMATWALTTPAVSGILNVTSPTPVTNDEFSREFARALARPSWLRVPAVALRAVFGEMAVAMLINGQRVVPKHALDLGFGFKYPVIADAMTAAVGKKTSPNLSS
jgi:NAD dependent epimerase/dehydratase family enzyme